MDTSIIISILLAVVGSCITLYYSQHSKKLTHEQMQMTLFAEFNKRYDLLNNQLNIIEQKYPTLDLLNDADDKVALKQAVIDYFSLCAEEFYWFHHKNRIDPIIWNSWQAGMSYWYNKVPAIKALWQQEIEENGKASYYITDNVEFFNESTNHE